MKQTSALWCVVFAQAAFSAWLWYSIPKHEGPVVADEISAESAFEKRFQALDKDVTRLRINESLGEKRIEDLERRVTVAIDMAQKAGMLAVKNKPAVAPLNALAEEAQRKAEEARQRVQQDQNEMRLEPLERTLER